MNIEPYKGHTAMDSIDEFYGYNFIELMYNLCFFG